jgi:NADPH:quinone reductase-like Zn-dependent oxidoreductase
MKAVLLVGHGGPEMLRYGDAQDPVAGPGEIVVDVHAASVNAADYKVRLGSYDSKLKFPYILGRDFSGLVSAIGPGVTDLAVGDAVFGVMDAGIEGCYAEKVAIKAALVAKKPAKLGHAEAAAMALTSLTAIWVLEDTARLKRGETILIQGGAGGVAGFAIQLAKHLGATVATTTSAKNAELVKSLGADVVIDYETEDFGRMLSGYDLVLNSQDTRTLEKSLRVLRPGGLLISISGPPDPAFAKDQRLNLMLKLAMRLLSRRVRKQAQSLDVRYAFLFMRAQGQQLGRITSLIESGVIRPVVDKVFPFASTAEALAYVETGRARGKVVIATD